MPVIESMICLTICIKDYRHAYWRVLLVRKSRGTVLTSSLGLHKGLLLMLCKCVQCPRVSPAHSIVLNR